MHAQRSEQALEKVNQTLAFYRSGQKSRIYRADNLSSRWLRTRSVQYQRNQIWAALSTQDTLLRLVAITEEFTFELLVEITEARLPRTDLVFVLWEAEMESFGENWAQRLGAWTKLHQINAPDAFPQYGELLGFIEARNAIVHGLGSLSRKQIRNRRRHISRLAAAGIQVNGDALVFTAQHVERCAATIKSFIRWLDSQQIGSQ